jgi:hypothetical protein
VIKIATTIEALSEVSADGAGDERGTSRRREVFR